MDTGPQAAPAPAVRRRASIRRRAALAAFGIVAGLLVLEAVLRLAARQRGGTDEVFGVELVPYPPPPERAGPGAPDEGYIAYDPATGWAPRPLGADPSGPYCADQFGLRAPRAEPRTLDDGRVRVVLFGDSFAHSDEVSYEESLGVALERQVAGSQVLIAGVPAYGTDLAFLRYLALRDALHPRVVVICVHPNDFFRNVALWTSSGYSKPRFVEDGDGLRIINQPPLRGPGFRAVFRDFERWEYAPYCFEHVAGTFDERPSDASMVLRFLRSYLAVVSLTGRYAATTTVGAESEVHRISRRIVHEFIRSAEAAGSRAVVAVLPSGTDVEHVRRGNDWWTAALRGAVDGTSAVLADPTADVRDAIDSQRIPASEMYTKGGHGHFTARGNAFVAEELRVAVGGAVERVRSGR